MVRRIVEGSSAPRTLRPRLRALALAVACGAVAACGSGGGPDPVAPTAAPPVGRLVPADERTLVESYRGGLLATRPTGDVAAAPPPMPASGGGESLAAPPASEPFVQEPGVDEADVVRVAGDTVWALTPPWPDGAQRLAAFRVADGGARLERAGLLALAPGLRHEGLYVDAARSRVVVVASGDATGGGIGLPIPATGSLSMPPPRPVDAALVFVDASDPAAPRVASTLRIAGGLAATRIADGRLWAVVRSRPSLEGFDWAWRQPEANERWIAGLTAGALLPVLRVDDGPARPLAAPDACYLQPGAVAPGGPITTVAAFDLAAPAASPLARCVASSVDTVLVARDAMVLASSGWRWSGDPTDGRGESVTDVHRFALTPASIAYRGSATVPGRLGRGADTGRFMLSVDGPRLRVLTQRDAFAALDASGGASPALLTVLEDRGGGELATVSTLPNARRPEPIGKPGEQVHGVRFVGQRAYVVTFRRTDPVYAIDLADPADPRLLGALEVPGFSDRLYPIAEGLLLGVGHDTVDWQGTDVRTGVLVSLIDVRDPSRPVERARRTIGGPGSGSASDLSPLGTTIRVSGDRVRVALPVTEHEGLRSAWATWMPEALRPRAFSRLAAHRWIVDPAAASLVDAAAVAAPDAASYGSVDSRVRDPAALAFDRAIDVGDTTWLWFDGRFVGGGW